MTRRNRRVATQSPQAATVSPTAGRQIDPPRPRRWLLVLTAAGVLAWIAFLAYLAWREA